MVRMRQVVDWRAALWAGLIAGTVFLALALFVVPRFDGGDGWAVIRIFASIVLGERAMAPGEVTTSMLVVAVATHYVLSTGFALLIAFVLHRWGLIVGVLGGAAFGLALHWSNVHGMTRFFPYFGALNSTAFLAAHVLFGAAAGAVYELLEVERFERVDDDPRGGA